MPEPTDYPEMVRRARQAGEMPPLYMPPHVRALGDIMAPDLTRYLAEPTPSMHERLRGLGGDIRGPGATLIPGPGDKLPTSNDPRELPAWFDATMLAGNVLGGLGAKGVLAAAPIAAKVGKAAAKAGAKEGLTLGKILEGAAEEAPAAAKTPPVELGAYPTTKPRRILKETQEGGYSVRVPTGERPTEGYMMGIYSNDDPRNLVVRGRAPSLADVEAHGKTNIKALQLAERHYGTWRDPATGDVYFDVSQRFPPDEKRQATKFGERTGQISGWDVAAKEPIPVGDWKKFIQDPEFHARMHQMATEGRQYLSQFPAKEWWDMHGSPFERVYGPQNMPQTAGFTASTAPNAAPRENLQTMTEYMRRYIKGEEIIQPDWRVPETAMSRIQGSKIGMEAGRQGNLEKSARGEYAVLGGDKVRNEALAMMGDPNAVVLDRHWARLGEKPEAGIYTGSQEGVIRGPSYDLMKAEVTKAARSVGRDPRDFSADAWTGIRDTIQRTGELFGQKFKGESIRGESKSYADHFEDLIREKAAHLKISVQEMETRLRNGDAELLSIMLGAPTIAAAYRYWDADRNAAASNADRSANAPSL